MPILDLIEFVVSLTLISFVVHLKSYFAQFTIFIGMNLVGVAIKLVGNLSYIFITYCSQKKHNKASSILFNCRVVAPIITVIAAIT
jgi:hypothetical protein